MIDRHQDHDHAAKHVHRFEAGAFDQDGLGSGGHPGECSKKRFVAIRRGRRTSLDRTAEVAAPHPNPFPATLIQEVRAR
jgi:hypothetical protein